MASIFDLKQSAEELPSLNQGTAKLTYQQVQTTRDVTGSNFPNGVINLNFEVSGTRWFLPSRTYLRMRATYRKSDDATQLSNGNDVSPNMGTMANLFQSAEFLIGDKTVSTVSNFMPQVDALQKRLTKSQTWLNGVGSSLEWWDPSFRSRQNKITSDGYLREEKKAQYVRPAATTRVLAGFNALTTIEIVALDSTAVFALGGVNLIEGPGILHEGDVIILANDVRYEVKNIVSSTVAEVKVLNLATILNDAAAVDAFTIERVQDQADNNSPNREGVEFIWQPNLSIFGVPHALPTGKYTLRLTPATSSVYQKLAIESVGADRTTAADFTFSVVDMYLYVSTVEGPAVDTMSYFMSLEETRCQTENINNTTGFQQKSFDVSPSTYALTIAFQDQLADGSDTRRSASKFKIRPITGNTDYPSGELALQRFYVNYNAENKPSPDADPNYQSPRDYISSRYAESLIYSGAYHDAAGGESKPEWLDRGLYMYFSYPKDGNSEATRVIVNYQFRTLLDADSGRVLLFDHYKKMVLVSIVNGRVVDVVVQDG